MDGSADTTTTTAAHVASVVNADDVPFTTAASVDDPSALQVATPIKLDYGEQIRGLQQKTQLLQQNMQRLYNYADQEFEARAYESRQHFETLDNQIKAVSDMLGHIVRLSLATKRNIAGARDLRIGYAPIRVEVDGFDADSDFGSGSDANTSYGTASSEDENDSASTAAAQQGEALRARLRLRM